MFGETPRCPTCNDRVYFSEQIKALEKVYHRWCFKCTECDKTIEQGKQAVKDNLPYCQACYKKSFGPKGYGYGIGAGIMAGAYGGSSKSLSTTASAASMKAPASASKKVEMPFSIPERDEDEEDDKKPSTRGSLRESLRKSLRLSRRSSKKSIDGLEAKDGAAEDDEEW